MSGALTWHLAFERGRTPWGHVLAFAFDGRSWIVVDPHVCWTEVFTLAPGAQFDVWIADVASRSRIYRVEPGGRAWPWSGLFCVGKVKHLAGIRSGAFSPEGLRRHLVHAGAEQVFIREDQGPEGRSDHQGGA